MTDGERFIASVREYLGCPKVIVDVGAHRGESAVSFKEAFKDAHVLAVDPISLDLQACWNAGVVPVVAACASVWGPRDFYLEEDSRLSGFYPRNVNRKGMIFAAGLPLDYICPVADAIKIDVEGAAWDVLYGGSQALAHARVVQLETETGEFFAGQKLEAECFFILGNYGYKKVWEERNLIDSKGQQTESVWVRQ